MKILVCGGRDFGHVPDEDDPEFEIQREQREHIWQVLDTYQKKYPNLELIAGGAKGADTCAEQWAEANSVKIRVFKANWMKYGKSAGPIRNQQMLDEGKPDMILAFPGGRGTKDMTERAREVGIEVKER